MKEIMKKIAPFEAPQKDKAEWGDTVTFDCPPRFTSGCYRYHNDNEKIVEGEIVEQLQLERK